MPKVSKKSVRSVRTKGKANSFPPAKPESKILTGYPNGPSFFPDAMKLLKKQTKFKSKNILNKSLIKLGPALTKSQVKTLLPNVPLILKDQNGRIIMADGDMNAVWNWAYFGQYTDYPSAARSVIFSSASGGNLTTALSGKTKSLFANGTSTSWEWAFWGDSSYNNNSSYIRANTTAEWFTDTVFKLFYTQNGTKMYLKADPGTWNWAYWQTFDSRAPTQTPLNLTAHQYYYMSVDLVKALLNSSLPSSWLSSLKIYPADKYYCLLDDAAATQIWNNGSLPGKKYSAEKFDCDDYAFVYKGECSLKAYSDPNIDYAYATGFVWGTSPTAGHAVNLFINYQGEVKILEPQTGEISKAGIWGYTPFLSCL